MIESHSEFLRYVRADLDRYGSNRPATLARLPQARWQVRLRLTEWWCNTRRGPVGRAVGAVLRQRLQAAGGRLGYTIPVNVVGPGLRLPHVGTIVLNGSARVGANCQILHNVTLGGDDRGAPEIGDSVFLGPGAQVIGAVHVGEGARIAAGAVVTRDVPPGQTWGGQAAAELRRRPAVDPTAD